MITLTITQSAPKATQTNRVMESFDSLLNLFEKYGKGKDPLTRDIIDWGLRTIEELDKTSDLNDLSRLGQRALHTLRTEILVDSLYKKPLFNPMLDHIWVFDEAFLRRYVKRINFSPFDGHKMHARTHQFAKEMLKWLATSTAEVDPSESKEQNEDISKKTTQKIVAADLPFSDAEIVSIFHLAKTRLSNEEAQMLGKLGEQLKKAEKRLADEIRAKIEVEEKRAQQREAEREKIINNTLDEIQKNHSATTSSLRGQLMEETGRLNETKETVASQGKSIASLNAEVANLRNRVRDNERRIDDLSNKGHRCTVM